MFTPMTGLSPTRWLAGMMSFLAATVVAGATNSAWSMRAWQAADGLPDNTVVGVEQATDGFLWVATQEGLVRFDGIRFQEFAPVSAAGEASGLIHAQFLDRRGRLWIAKELGALVCVDAGRTTAFTSMDGLPAMEARQILDDPDGALWISYLGGDVACVRDGKVRSYTATDGLPRGGTCQLAMGNDAQLWFSKGAQVGVFRAGRFVALATWVAQRIAAASSGGLWTCVGVTLSKYREGAGITACGTLPTDLPNVTPTVLFEDHSGVLWIGTSHAGLFRYDGLGITSVGTSHHEIRCLSEDREGNVWVGTRGGGLNRLRPRIAEVVDVGSGVPWEAVRSACQDVGGVLWAVAQSGTVVRKRASGWTPLSAKDGWSMHHAQCVAADPNGGVWIGTQYKGVHRWMDGKLVSSTSIANGLAHECVNVLSATEAGDLWVGTESADTLQHALQRERGGHWKTFGLPNRTGRILSMAADAGTNVWAATSTGQLLRVVDAAFVDETARTLATRQAIRCLHLAPDGSLWIGYAGRGVGRLKAGRFSLCQRQDGLHNDYISQMVSDGRGRLWFAGNQGIFSVNQRELDAFCDGDLPRIRSVGIGRNEGLPGIQAGHGFWPGAVASSEGQLWIPMQSGMAVIQTSGLTDDTKAPPIVIERVTVDGRTVARYEPTEGDGTLGIPRVPGSGGKSRPVRLRPGYRQVQFEFTAPSFAAPGNVGFKYRLQGLDPSWVAADERRIASYVHIPPGDYRFEVAACSEAGIWSEVPAGIAIIAEPYLWQTTWFQTVAPVSAIGLVAAGFLVATKRRHRYQLERLELERTMERERARIAQDLHDDLGAGLTQISLNTALAQNPAVTPDTAGGLLEEIDQRARELVAALDEIVWAVNPRNDTVPALGRYLCQFAQSCLQPAGIACRLEVAPGLPDTPVVAEQRHHLFLAFKEALHNAIRHSGASELRLEIAARDRTLSVTIADNGRGFTQGSISEGADGLGNMRERMSRLGGRCVVVTAPGQGTTVTFQLPLPTDRQ